MTLLCNVVSNWVAFGRYINIAFFTWFSTKRFYFKPIFSNLSENLFLTMPVRLCWSPSGHPISKGGVQFFNRSFLVNDYKFRYLEYSIDKKGLAYSLNDMHKEILARVWPALYSDNQTNFKSRGRFFLQLT